MEEADVDLEKSRRGRIYKADEPRVPWTAYKTDLATGWESVNRTGEYKKRL